MRMCAGSAKNDTSNEAWGGGGENLFRTSGLCMDAEPIRTWFFCSFFFFICSMKLFTRNIAWQLFGIWVFFFFFYLQMSVWNCLHTSFVFALHCTKFSARITNVYKYLHHVKINYFFSCPFAHNILPTWHQSFGLRSVTRGYFPNLVHWLYCEQGCTQSTFFWTSFLFCTVSYKIGQQKVISRSPRSLHLTRESLKIDRTSERWLSTKAEHHPWSRDNVTPITWPG